MNKKAASIIMIIFELLVVILVVFMTMEVARGMGKSDTVFKINLANDLRMMLDTLVGVPGEAVVEYPYNVSQYVVLLGQGKITVFKKGEADVRKVIRNFYLPEGYRAIGSLEEKERLCLEKKDKNIFLRECKPDEK